MSGLFGYDAWKASTPWDDEHDREPPIECDGCGATFISEDRLREVQVQGQGSEWICRRCWFDLTGGSSPFLLNSRNTDYRESPRRKP